MAARGTARVLCCAAALLTLPVAVAHGQGLGGAAQGSSSNVGYIDCALPVTEFRLRFEAADGIDRPDRAEFLYAPGFYPRLNYQDISQYVELAAGPRFSGFIELHQEFVQPEGSEDTGGLGDMNVGFKWALVREDDRVATFQLKTYIPTGNPERTLGTGHASLEPGLLVYRRLTEGLTFEGELRDWIPFGGDPVAGNVLRYGAGLGYCVYETERTRVSPVVEVVGWTVLDGKESVAPNVFADAAGDTIVNLKLGTRVWFGAHNDVYVGYGRALTGDVWYKNIVRAEYRLQF